MVKTRASTSSETTMEALRDDFKIMSESISTRLDRLELSIADRIKEVVLEQITNEKNELKAAMGELEKRLDSLEAKSVPDLSCNFVVYDMAEDEEENVPDKINSLIRDVLKVDNVVVASAERIPKYNGRDSGIIVAKCSTKEHKSKIMEAKSLLRHSEHYSHIRVYPDKPKWQRIQESNLRMLVKTLGPGKLVMKGNRVCDQAMEQQNFQQPQRGGHGRGRHMNRGQGRGYHGNQGRGNARGQGRNDRPQ